jgi:hypothetical protein
VDSGNRTILFFVSVVEERNYCCWCATFISSVATCNHSNFGDFLQNHSANNPSPDPKPNETMDIRIWSGKAVNFTTGVNKSDEAAPRCRVYSDLFLSHFIGGSSLPSNLLLNRFCVLGFNGLSPLQGLLSLQKKTSRARS